MIVGLILVFITSLLVLINPQISGMIVDEVIEGQHYEKLGILLLIMIGVTLVRSLLRFTFLMCFLPFFSHLAQIYFLFRLL